MGAKLDRLMSILLTTATVLIAAAFVKREFLPASARARPSATTEPMKTSEWDRVLSNGTVVGSLEAPVVVAAFTDFECGFCRLFLEESFTPVAREFAGKVSLVVVDFPIGGHRFARPAARAAACAGEQGKYQEYMYALLAGQDSLGLKTWASFAADVGVKRLDAFEKCVGRTAPVARVDSGIAMAKAMGIRGTPTVIINGWRYAGAPTADELRAIVKRVLSGEPVLPAVRGKAQSDDGEK